MHPGLIKSLASCGAWPLPDNIKLAVGIGEAKRLLGPARVKEAAASVLWPGAKRAKPRASWAPYCYDMGNGDWVVTCPDPANLPKMGWMSAPAIDAAVSHVVYLQANGKAWAPPNPIYSVDDWTRSRDGILAIDIEGFDGNVDRVSVCDSTQSLSVQWSKQVADWYYSLFDKTGVMGVAHNAPFDAAGLGQAGIHCTMVAHKLVNPWCSAALGHAAPLYVPGLTPWKHMNEDDPELYNLMDAAVLIPMWGSLVGCMDKRKSMGVYDADLRAEYLQFEHPDRITNTINGTRPTPVTRAAGIIETAKQGPGMPHLIDRWALLGQIVGAPIKHSKVAHLEEIQWREALGYGVRQIRNGSSEYPNGVAGMPKAWKDGAIGGVFHKFREANPAYKAWSERLRRQAGKDSYVTALDGRRAYGLRGGETQRFVIWAEIGRRLKATLPFNPLYLNHMGAIASKADPRILEALANGSIPAK